MGIDMLAVPSQTFQSLNEDPFPFGELTQREAFIWDCVRAGLVHRCSGRERVRFRERVQPSVHGGVGSRVGSFGVVSAGIFTTIVRGIPKRHILEVGELLDGV